MFIKEYYVYEYFVIETNEVFYVGKGKGKRAFCGRRNKFCENMKQSHNWKVRIVQDNMTEEEAFSKEVELISYYKQNTKFRITNQTLGGDGSSGFKMTESQKKTLSMRLKEKWEDETFKSSQLWHREHGVYKSNEFREKLSKLTKGHKNGNYNHRWSDEQKNNLSLKLKESLHNKGENNVKATKIMCIETGEKFNYIQLAMRKYNVKHEGSFSISFNEPTRTCANLHWVKIDTIKQEEYWSDDSNRLSYLEKCSYGKGKNQGIKLQCIETGEIFNNKKELRKKIKIGQTTLDNHLKNNTTTNINNYHYKIL